MLSENRPTVPTADGTAPRLVLVVGTGRSGTSTVAGILRRLGLHVPQPEVAVDEANPKGFGEPRWVVDFHDELLGRANVQVSDARPVAWQHTRQYAERPGARSRLDAWLGEQLDQQPDGQLDGQPDGARVLLVKDPRLAWFLPLWTAAAHHRGAAPACLTMLRPPPEVVGSKRASYNAQLADGHGVAAWLNMMLHTEQATRGLPRTFVRYHDLLAGWSSATARACGELGLSSLVVPDAARAEIDRFVDPALRRIDLTWDDLDLPDRLGSLARDAWRCLDTLADDALDEPVLDRLDELRAEYTAYYREAEVVSRSSVVAARASARADAQRALAAADPPRSSGRSLALRTVRRTPPWLRRLVPHAARTRVLSRLDGGAASSPGGDVGRP